MQETIARYQRHVRDTQPANKEKFIEADLQVVTFSFIFSLTLPYYNNRS